MNNLEEEKASLMLYKKSKQVLVSPSFLRKNGVGQVDLLFLNENFLSLIEVKKSGLISYGQKVRLLRSSQFIGSILDKDCQIKLFNSRHKVLMKF